MTLRINLLDQVVKKNSTQVLLSPITPTHVPIAYGCWAIHAPRSTTTLAAAQSRMVAHQGKSSEGNGSHKMMA